MVTALGRFHILVLHFPIAFLMIIPVLEIAGSFKVLNHVKQTIPVILIAAILFSAKACVLGYMLAAGEGDSGDLLMSHMWAGIITTILMIAALILRELYFQNRSKPVFSGYLAVLAGSLISLTLGSHDGASLVHGEDYLTDKLPHSLKRIFHPEHDEELLTEHSLVYDHVIRPIFEDNCYVCHSEAKQKADFRMDDFELLLYGGESGMAGIEPGSLEDSEVFYRVTLDPKKKGFMPPDGNDPLSTDEIEMIRWWIENGASTDKTIAELSPAVIPDAVQQLLSTAAAPKSEQTAPMELETFARLSTQAKQTYGIDVILNSQNPADGAYIVARNAQRELPAIAFTELLPLAPHVTSINLWRKQLDAKSPGQLAKFSAVKQLHLNETNIDQAGLSALTGLNNLKLLNLHSTAIGDESIETLGKFKMLNTLLLTDSAISTNGVEQLKEKLPNCEILAFSENVEVTAKTEPDTYDKTE